MYDEHDTPGAMTAPGVYAPPLMGGTADADSTA
jgi:hypothetical protein